MTENKRASKKEWVDPDDAPEWEDHHFERARFSIGGKVVKEATGTWTRPGRPPKENPKQQVSIRLDPDVLEAFRSTGKGWQSRINAELRKALGI